MTKSTQNLIKMMDKLFTEKKEKIDRSLSMMMKSIENNDYALAAVHMADIAELAKLTEFENQVSNELTDQITFEERAEKTKLKKNGIVAHLKENNHL